MLYLLDANVLIDANRDYYPLDRIPEFWEWLVYQGDKGYVKIPTEIYEEIKEGNDQLAAWTKQNDVEKALRLPEEAEVALVSMVVSHGYAEDLSDIEIIKVGKDPFLIAYALKEKGQRIVVTTEGSKPSRQRANRHVPDVCRDFGIRSCHTFQFVRALNFSTKWKTSL